jgi:hypothetical protein
VSAAWKSWGDHSDRWKKNARREGLDPNRWNRWRRLSPKTRKDTNPRNYAKGESIARQKRSKLEENVIKRMKENPFARDSTIRHNVEKLTNRDLHWAEKASGEALRHRAAGSSSWWYR